MSAVPPLSLPLLTPASSVSALKSGLKGRHLALHRCRRLLGTLPYATKALVVKPYFLLLVTVAGLCFGLPPMLDAEKGTSFPPGNVDWQLSSKMALLASALAAFVGVFFVRTEAVQWSNLGLARTLHSPRNLLDMCSHLLTVACLPLFIAAITMQGRDR